MPPWKLSRAIAWTASCASVAFHKGDSTWLWVGWTFSPSPLGASLFWFPSPPPSQFPSLNSFQIQRRTRWFWEQPKLYMGMGKSTCLILISQVIGPCCVDARLRGRARLCWCRGINWDDISTEPVVVRRCREFCFIPILVWDPYLSPPPSYLK